MGPRQRVTFEHGVGPRLRTHAAGKGLGEGPRQMDVQAWDRASA